MERMKRNNQYDSALAAALVGATFGLNEPSPAGLPPGGLTTLLSMVCESEQPDRPIDATANDANAIRRTDLGRNGAGILACDNTLSPEWRGARGEGAGG
jgi:hypothetical protein